MTVTARLDRVASAVALLAEGVDRNIKALAGDVAHAVSPSSRRAWIEIVLGVGLANLVLLSPSSRRAWIEIMPFSR